MSIISVNNNYNGNSIYTAKQNSQSEISSLIKERESLQKELQSLQKEATSNSGSDSETLQSQIETLQSQITNIDSQIAKLQAEDEKKINNNSSNNEKKVESPSTKLDNSKTLNITLNKLDENTKLLEHEIILDKVRGHNTEGKDKLLSNIKSNIENINSKLQESKGSDSKTLSEDIELVGNFVDNEA